MKNTTRSFLCSWEFMGQKSTKSFAIQRSQDLEEAATAARKMGLKPHTLVTEVVTREPWPLGYSQVDEEDDDE